MTPEQALQWAALFLREAEVRDFQWDGKQWVKKPQVPMSALLSGGGAR